MADRPLDEAIATGRWTAKRKLDLVNAVLCGQLGEAEVAAIGVSADELASWRERLGRHGLDGLKAMKLQQVGR